MGFFSFFEQKKRSKIARIPKKERADVLLVYPVWVKKGGRGKLQRMLPPLGILSIASYLETKGYEVHIIDLHTEQIGIDEFCKILEKLRPRFVGISVLSAHVTAAHHVAMLCKKTVADCKVYVGGVHAEAQPEAMLENPAIDAVGCGDGEELMEELVRGVPYKDILGLSYRQDDKMIHNKRRPINMDLDQYPFPAYHLIDFDLYFPPVGSYKDLPAMNVLMTRGCPGKCTFCNSAFTKLRSRSVDNMVAMLKLLHDKFGIRQIYFYDDTFTSSPVRVKEFCELMIAENVKIRWICYVRGDMFRDNIAQLMAQAGCHQVLMGIESGDTQIMDQIGKKIPHDRYQKVVETAHKYGIEVRGSFIIGHREETQASMNATLKLAMDLDLDFFQLNILTPYPGTQLYREAKENGWLRHENFSLYGQNEVILSPLHLTDQEILDFEKKSFFRFYLRPIAIYRQLKRLTRWSHAKDLIKAAVVIFFEGIGKTYSQSEKDHMAQWLDFKLEEKNKDPHPIRLTYEVRE